MDYQQWLEAFSVDLRSVRPDIEATEVELSFLVAAHAAGRSPGDVVRGHLPLVRALRATSPLRSVPTGTQPSPSPDGWKNGIVAALVVLMSVLPYYTLSVAIAVLAILIGLWLGIANALGQRWARIGALIWALLMSVASFVGNFVTMSVLGAFAATCSLLVSGLFCLWIDTIPILVRRVAAVILALLAVTAPIVASVEYHRAYNQGLADSKFEPSPTASLVATPTVDPILSSIDADERKREAERQDRVAESQRRQEDKQRRTDSLDRQIAVIQGHMDDLQRQEKEANDNAEKAESGDERDQWWAKAQQFQTQWMDLLDQRNKLEYEKDKVRSEQDP